MTFDLDLWPTDMNIKKDHLLIKDYLPTKFEFSGAKSSWVISRTRHGRPTWPLTYWPELSREIIYSSRTIYLPSLKFLGPRVLELSVTKGVGDQQDLNINKDHLIIKDYLPTTFEAPGAKSSRVISCTRCGRPTWPLTLTHWPEYQEWLSTHKGLSTYQVWSWGRGGGGGQRGLELSVAQGEVDWHDIWPWPLTYWPKYEYVSCTSHGLSIFQVWSMLGKAFLSYQLHKVKGYRHTVITNIQSDQ